MAIVPFSSSWFGMIGWREDCQQEVSAGRGIIICFYLFFFDKRGYRLVALVGILTLDVCILDIHYEKCAAVHVDFR